MGVDDVAVGDAELVEPCRPLLQLVAVGAAEGDVIEPGTALVELGRGGEVREAVQAEQRVPSR